MSLLDIFIPNRHDSKFYEVEKKIFMEYCQRVKEALDKAEIPTQRSRDKFRGEMYFDTEFIGQKLRIVIKRNGDN